MVGFLVSKPKDLIAAFSSPLEVCWKSESYSQKREKQKNLSVTPELHQRSLKCARVNGARTIGVEEVESFSDFIYFVLPAFQVGFSQPWHSCDSKFLSQVLGKSRLVVSQLFSWRTTPELRKSFGEICQHPTATHRQGTSNKFCCNPQAFARP